MYWRPIHASDLTECLELQSSCIGDQLVGRDRARRIWRNLLDSPAFNASVIESDELIDGHRIVGCGMGVFVDSRFADRELATPRPGLNSRIIESIANGRSVLLDRDGIAAGNAVNGLDYVNLYGTWHQTILNADQVAEVQALLGTSFVEAFAGYRFNRVLKETIGQPLIDLARATGTYRLVAEFPQTGSALAVVCPDSARAAPYSLAARIYRYQAPVLHLRPAEQALLGAALDGKTDAELSEKLGLSLEAVKKRWISIFGRFDEFSPEVLASTVAENARRGPQKRHRVVAYVRNHLEELRPYLWD
jgi:hypothetical protein